MKKITQPPALLFLISILAYGLLIPSLGFYWDDLPMSWIRYQLGSEAMAEYFSTNRPVWAWLYQLTAHLLPHSPINWQLFALFWRWAGSVVLWALAKKLFPERGSFALILSLIFLIYPGFNQQWVSYLYSHFFIVLLFFLLSLYLMLRGKTIPALIFSALNLWMMEYFFTLELIRPFVIWTSLEGESLPNKQRVVRVLKLWLPYLAVFVLAILSRIFVFNNQVYGFSIKDAFLEAPIETTFLLAQNVLVSVWTVLVSAWIVIFDFPNPVVDGSVTAAMYTFVVIAVAAPIIYGLARRVEGGKRNSSFPSNPILLGAIMMLLAGPPFWLTNVPISLGFPANRATLSFILGIGFVFSGLLEYLPSRSKIAIVAVIIGLSAGRQFLWSNEYRRDWTSHKNFFWQMTWRAPNLEMNTVVLVNEELTYYADNSLSAALNWIYAPGNHRDRMNYVLLYPTNRDQLVLLPNIPVEFDFLVGKFKGNTSQAVVFYYAPPGCLRLLDPEIDTLNRLIPEDTMLREAAMLSSTDPILSEPVAQMPDVYYPEPAHGWCYFFQKADLARQLKDWDEVTTLGKVAFALDDYPNDPVERFVFIEGYAHIGDWKKAVELSTVSYKVSKNYMGEMLCALWNRIERETSSADERDVVLNEMKAILECGR